MCVVCVCVCTMNTGLKCLNVFIWRVPQVCVRCVSKALQDQYCTFACVCALCVCECPSQTQGGKVLRLMHTCSMGFANGREDRSFSPGGSGELRGQVIPTHHPHKKPYAPQQELRLREGSIRRFAIHPSAYAKSPDYSLQRHACAGHNNESQVQPASPPSLPGRASPEPLQRHEEKESERQVKKRNR